LSQEEQVHQPLPFDRLKHVEPLRGGPRRVDDQPQQRDVNKQQQERPPHSQVAQQFALEDGVLEEIHGEEPQNYRTSELQKHRWSVVRD
jgi:hypothetical protein